MTPRQFLSELSALRFENAFNPYSERCAVWDVDDAPRRRSDMLLATLEAAARVQVDAIWIGRDLGYRGGRRTGLPFTDDTHLTHHQSRWGIEVTRPTKGNPVSERAATVVWTLLQAIDRPIVLWNVFPLHPHAPGEPFSNRMHTAAERQVGVDLLGKLVEILRPSRLIAIGNDAEKAALGFSSVAEVVKVRHPSYGGQPEFLNQIRRLYDVREQRLL